MTRRPFAGGTTTPPAPTSTLLGARIAEARGDAPGSLALATQAAQQAPGDAAVLEGASQVAQQAGDGARSRAWLEAALAATPDSPRLTRELGLRFAAAPEEIPRTRAIPLLEQARLAYPEDFISAASLGDLYTAIGDNARAMTRIEDAIDLQPIDLTVGNDSATDLAERRYRLRRQHETLTRRDRIHPFQQLVTHQPDTWTTQRSRRRYRRP